MAADTSSENSQSYTVVLRGEVFALSHSQIYFDSPNYFTTCFSCGFAESKDRRLRLDRNPALFAIIVDYLSGYTVLPIPARAIPPTMTEETTLDNLLADARFYDLQGLQDLLLSARLGAEDLTWMGFANQIVSLRDILAHDLPRGVVEQDDGSIVSDDGLPVLVSARGMVARFNYFREFEVYHPTTMMSVEFSFRDSLGPHLNVVSCYRDGQIIIDGISHILHDLHNALERREVSDSLYSLTNTLQHTSPDTPVDTIQCHAGVRVKCTSYSYWIDEMLCCLEKRSEDSHIESDSTARPAKLLRVTLRSMCGILAGIKALQD